MSQTPETYFDEELLDDSLENEVEETEEVVDEVEVDEDGNPVEYDGEEESDEVTDEADEEETDEEAEAGSEESIIIPYPDENGKMRNWEVGLDEIPALVEMAAYGEKAKQYVKQTEEYLNSKSNAITIGEAATNDPLMRQVLQWKASGYSDKDIASGLYTYFTENDMPSGEEDELEIDPALKAALEKHIAPIKSQLDKSQMEQRESETLRRNDEVIISAMQQSGIVNGLSDSETNAFRKTFSELYPGYNTRSQVLTPTQIKVVLRESGILNDRDKSKQPAKVVKKATKTGAIIKGKQAPKISPAKTGTQPREKTESRSTSSSAVYARLGW